MEKIKCEVIRDLMPLVVDDVASAESKELAEKGFLTSSCCPAFVRYIQTAFPTLVEHISHNPSPAAALGSCRKDCQGEGFFVDNLRAAVGKDKSTWSDL